MKSDKMPYIIYADMEFLIKRQMDVQTIQKTLQQKKTSWACSLWAFNVGTIIWAIDCIENKHTLNHGKNCMKKFCETLRKTPKI